MHVASFSTERSKTVLPLRTPTKILQVSGQSAPVVPGVHMARSYNRVIAGPKSSYIDQCVEGGFIGASERAAAGAVRFGVRAARTAQASGRATTSPPPTPTLQTRFSASPA